MGRVRRIVVLALALFAAAQEAPAPARSRLDETNRKAAEHVYRTVARPCRLLKTQLQGLRKEDVIVVGGLFDFIQELLVAFRCPHTVITPAELEYVPIEHPERMIFFLNCHLIDRNFPKSQPRTPRPDASTAKKRLEKALAEAGFDAESPVGKAIRERFKEVKYFAGSDYSQAGLRRLGEAVRKGGAWMMSTDWALLAVERALPGTVRWTGRSTYEETVRVEPTRAGKRDPLLLGAFPPSGRARWWLETESYLFALKGRGKVLIESRALASRYHGDRAVVALAEAGKGKVLHALSHAYLQKAGSADAAVMQRMLVNFLIAKSLENFNRATALGDRERDR